MKVIHASNVCSAYTHGMLFLQQVGEPEASRVGDVLVAPYPVTTCYAKPTERVLFDARRDANPFFHLIESVWMLAGRRDATFLDRYVSDFSSRFAEADGDAHGAYGARWRSHFNPDSNTRSSGTDQIVEIGDMLFEDPKSRRAVLQMWDPLTDLGASKRDLPCNTNVFFRYQPTTESLDVTVCNRSNDIIWGAYGANAVHMSVMGEVIAGLAGLRLGAYYQVSNNWHAYTSVFKKYVEDIACDDRYWSGQVEVTPIVVGDTLLHRRASAQDVLWDAIGFCNSMDMDRLESFPGAFSTEFFRHTVVPVELSHRLWRHGNRQAALEKTVEIRGSDWRTACQEWMQRRMK